MNNITEMQKVEPKISRTWLAGGNKAYPSKSIVLTIPAEFAHAYDLREPSTVLITGTESGILIKKLEVPTN